GAVLWQGLKSEAVERMPTIGRSSASSVKPAPLRNPRRRNSANSSSPYWARRDRRPFFMAIPQTQKRTCRRHCSIEGAEVSTKKGVARPMGDEIGRADRTARGKGGFSRRSLGCGGDGISRRTPIGRHHPAKGSSQLLRKFGGFRRTALAPRQAGAPFVLSAQQENWQCLR